MSEVKIITKYTLKQLVIDSILDYPSLYKDINYKLSRQKILNHLFFVNGNGFTWQKGVLCYDTGSESIPSLTTRKFPEDYFEKTIWSKEEDEPEWIKKHIKPPYKPHEICSKHALIIYPICKYAKICNIPENIQNDFLEGALSAIEIAFEFFNDPHKYMVGAYCKEWSKERQYDKIKEYITKQKHFLSEAKTKLLTIKSNI